MRLRVTPGSSITGAVRVPGDKSISHRWLILASTARGASRLVGVPASLDVRSTARCMATVTPPARPALEAWATNAAVFVEDGGSTWNCDPLRRALPALEVEGEGRDGLIEPTGPLECGNSGTTMRLLMGLLSSLPFASALTGDASLALRPMERVAEPLRRMGADVRTSDGRPPVTVRGSSLAGIDFTSPVPSAQVKSAVLLAGVAASGVTTVREPLPTRDHTERALQALGVPIDLRTGTASVRRFQHEGFAGSVPGDPSTAAFLVAAAALTGSPLEIHGLALNPTRTHFLEVLGRMGVRTESRIEDHQLGEPVGGLFVAPCDGLTPVRVEPHELPLVVDEVPVLAAIAAHAPGESWFLGAEELRLKESDRLQAIAAGIRELGGHAADEGMDLVVAGGGLEGGRTDARGDHRIALSLAVAALAARAPCEIDGFESADVSFPGAAGVIRELGGRVEVTG